VTSIQARAAANQRSIQSLGVSLKISLRKPLNHTGPLFDRALLFQMKPWLAF